MRICLRRRACPLVSPFFQRRLRERLKKCTSPLFQVSSSALGLTKPSMRTSLLDASCKIAGINPPSFSNASSTTFPQNKNPAWRCAPAGCFLLEICKGARQDSTGAVDSRDDGGVDAPENSCHRQSTG